MAEGAIERESKEQVSRVVAEALLASGAVQFDFEKGFQFVSGLQSPVYVDSRMLFNQPDTREITINALAQYIHDQDINVDVVAGTAIGGVAPAALLAQQLEKSFVYVRKDEKAHGRKRQIEGGEVAEKETLLIEDLVSTGTSSMSAVSILREAQAEVHNCLAITSYGFAGTPERFADAQVQLHTLTDVSTIVDVAHEHGFISFTQRASIHEWLKQQGVE